MGRLATDIGGTFTDLIYFSKVDGALETAKSLTTPDDLTRGIVETIRQSGLPSSDVEGFVHGGTTVINAITERKGVKTALITTSGFRDVLEIQRGNRPDLYNLRFDKERPLVPRRLRLEVSERIDHAGKVIAPLSYADLDRAIQICRKEKVKAVAIQFLHSYVEPQHEAAAVAYVRQHLSDVAVTASYEITREWREYERATTAVLNAYVQPIMQSYLGRLEGMLSEEGIECPLSAMQSNGGTTSFSWAREHPIALIESGPAAGCNGAAVVGALCGEKDVIYLDIGGTTAKCTTIENGKPIVTTEYKLEYSRTRFGYPLRIPVVDIVEIGTGGGSIAWFDQAGLLKVGPVSAGADPGPACYGRGGCEPTVTDAKLITEVINPSGFAGGQFDLDVDAARTAMRKIADGLGVSVQEAAVAVIRTAEAAMVNALKLVSIQRGHDPRDFSLIVGGGGGGMHGALLGRELGVKEIIVPLHPGLFSAWGMLVTEPRRDFQLTKLISSDDVSHLAILEIFNGLREEAAAYYQEDADLSGTDVTYEGRIDMRYVGQEHTVSVPVDSSDPVPDTILDRFHAAHEKTYTFQLDDTPVEFVTYRLTAYAKVEKLEIKPLSAAGRPLELALQGVRAVDFAEDGRHDTGIYRRDLLPPGASFSGPAIIEEATSTTLILPGQSVRVDDYGFLHIADEQQ